MATQWEGAPFTFRDGRKPKNCYRKANSPHWWCDIQIGNERFHRSTGCEDAKNAEGFVEDQRARMKEEALVRKLVSKTGIRKRTPITFAEAVEKYWSEVCREMKCAATYEYQLANLLNGMGDKANKPMIDLTTADFTAYRGARRFQPNMRGGKISGSTINREVELARRMFNWLDDLEFEVPPIKWRQALDTTAEVKRNRELKPDEEIRFFEAMQRLHPELALMCEFAMLCGQRLSAIINLTWDRVDRHNREITVFLKTRQKQPKPHTVPLGERMAEIIDSFPHVDGEDRVFTYLSTHGGGARRREGRRLKAVQRRLVQAELEPRRKGVRYAFTEDGWRTTWKKAMKEAGITNLRFHDLRHTALTRVVRETGNLKLAMELAGHANIHETARYAHADKSDVRAALAAVEARRNVIRENVEQEQAPALAIGGNVVALRPAG